jgi:hypothetical protein
MNIMKHAILAIERIQIEYFITYFIERGYQYPCDSIQQGPPLIRGTPTNKSKFEF